METSEKAAVSPKFPRLFRASLFSPSAIQSDYLRAWHRLPFAIFRAYINLFSSTLSVYAPAGDDHDGQIVLVTIVKFEEEILKK